jgi:hypothetical protein
MWIALSDLTTINSCFFNNFKLYLMKQKTKSIPYLKRWVLATLAATVAFSSCQKEISNDTSSKLQTANAKIQLPLTTNPYSLKNVQKAQETISQANVNSRTSATSSLSGLPQYIYFKFNPAELTTEQFQTLENDSTVKLLDFPFANASLYSETFALDEAKKEQLTDGSIYGITSITNTASLCRPCSSS